MTGQPADPRVYPSEDWLRGTGEMVWCPGCAFGFGSEHVTTGTDEYDCPNCGASSGDSDSPDREPVSAARVDAERTFNEPACERLIASGRQYQDEHGHYLPTLAWLLNETRRERDEALAALASARGERHED